MKHEVPLSYLLVIGLALLCLVVAAINSWASTPVVTFSHSTGECVKVYSADDEFSCESLPPKYETLWAK